MGAEQSCDNSKAKKPSSKGGSKRKEAKEGKEGGRETGSKARAKPALEEEQSPRSSPRTPLSQRGGANNSTLTDVIREDEDSDREDGIHWDDVARALATSQEGLTPLPDFPLPEGATGPRQSVDPQCQDIYVYHATGQSMQAEPDLCPLPPRSKLQDPFLHWRSGPERPGQSDARDPFAEWRPRPPPARQALPAPERQPALPSSAGPSSYATAGGAMTRGRSISPGKDGAAQPRLSPLPEERSGVFESMGRGMAAAVSGRRGSEPLLSGRRVAEAVSSGITSVGNGIQTVGSGLSAVASAAYNAAPQSFGPQQGGGYPPEQQRRRGDGPREQLLTGPPEPLEEEWAGVQFGLAPEALAQLQAPSSRSQLRGQQLSQSQRPASSQRLLAQQQSQRPAPQLSQRPQQLVGRMQSAGNNSSFASQRPLASATSAMASGASTNPIASRKPVASMAATRRPAEAGPMQSMGAYPMQQSSAPTQKMLASGHLPMGPPPGTLPRQPGPPPPGTLPRGGAVRVR